MTLYRVADKSQVIDALIEAAENGKEVIVLVELRARFDEANNIEMSHRLEAQAVRYFTDSEITRFTQSSVSSQRKRAMVLSTSLRLIQETTTRRPRVFIQIYPSSLQIRRLEQMHQGCLWRFREVRLFRTEM